MAKRNDIIGVGVINLLGERLIELRNRRKLTQQEIANKMHLSRSTYAQYEINRRVPEYLTLEKLADFFEVSIDYLVGREENKEGVLTETQKELFKEFASLSDEDKDYVLGLIRRIQGK